MIDEQLIKWADIDYIEMATKELEKCKCNKYLPRFITINQDGTYMIGEMVEYHKLGDIIDMDEYCDKRLTLQRIE